MEFNLIQALADHDWLSAAVYIFGILWAAIRGTEMLNNWRSTTRYHWADKLSQIAEGVAIQVYEEYVREIKKGREDGKLTQEERNAARNKALNLLVDSLKQQGIDGVKQFGVPYLEAAIEKAVGNLKQRTGLRLKTEIIE